MNNNVWNVNVTLTFNEIYETFLKRSQELFDRTDVDDTQRFNWLAEDFTVLHKLCEVAEEKAKKMNSQEEKLYEIR